MVEVEQREFGQGRAAATVIDARKHARPLLRMVNKTVAERVRAGRHVLLEPSRDSEA